MGGSKSRLSSKTVASLQDVTYFSGNSGHLFNGMLYSSCVKLLGACVSGSKVAKFW